MPAKIDIYAHDLIIVDDRLWAIHPLVLPYDLTSSSMLDKAFSQGFDFAYSATTELADCVMRSGRASNVSEDCVAGGGPWGAAGRSFGATNRYEFFEKAVERRLDCESWRHEMASKRLLGKDEELLR